MEYKLYVGNLSYTTTEADLQTLFTQAGGVKSVALIKDRDSGRSKGFAFVEMENQQDMQNAITMFNGKDLQGRDLGLGVDAPDDEVEVVAERVHHRDLGGRRLGHLLVDELRGAPRPELLATFRHAEICEDHPLGGVDLHSRTDVRDGEVIDLVRLARRERRLVVDVPGFSREAEEHEDDA